MVCGGLAKHVLDHTAVFLRGLRSCDSAFLSYAWPLGAVAYKTRTRRRTPTRVGDASLQRDEAGSVMHV